VLSVRSVRYSSDACLWCIHPLTSALMAFFAVRTTPERGRQVARNQASINSYKADRAGYWVILANCEKDAAKSLRVYREVALRPFCEF